MCVEAFVPPLLLLPRPRSDRRCRRRACDCFGEIATGGADDSYLSNIWPSRPHHHRRRRLTTRVMRQSFMCFEAFDPHYEFNVSPETGQKGQTVSLHTSIVVQVDKYY